MDFLRSRGNEAAGILLQLPFKSAVSFFQRGWGEKGRCVLFADGRSQFAVCQCSVRGWRAGQRDDHRVEGTGHGNRWSLVATQDPIKKDGRADLFLDPPCRANVPQRERLRIRIQKL